MFLRRILCGSATLIAALSLPPEVSARDIAIENIRGSKVKVCTYRSEDKSVFRPRKCWTLEDRKTILWRRGADDWAFDVRVFGPGVFELPICMQRDIRQAMRVQITPAKARNCVAIVDRDTVAVRNWNIDDHVMVNRDGDNFWYPAIILGRNGDGYWIRLANGPTAVEPAAYIAMEDIKSGSRIQCNWKRQGRWYAGTVLSRTGDAVMIKYDAGWTEADTISNLRVPPDAIGKLLQPVVE